jgi:hypothetical protein
MILRKLNREPVEVTEMELLKFSGKTLAKPEIVRCSKKYVKTFRGKKKIRDNTKKNNRI